MRDGGAQPVDNYFRQPGFDRLFAAIRDKYRSLGRMTGNAYLTDLGKEERAVLSGFLGCKLAGTGTVKIAVAQVDRILRESTFATSLEDLLSAYFEEELVAKSAERAQISSAWESLFAQPERRVANTAVAVWLAELKARKGEGYRVLQTLFKTDRVSAAQTLVIITEALLRLSEGKFLAHGQGGERDGRQGIRLPVFAASLTGDPHALDVDQPAGRLLLSGIAFLAGTAGTVEGAERRRYLLRLAGLLDDDISSQVFVAGLRLKAEDPCASMLDNAACNKTPLVLTLRFLLDSARVGWEAISDVWVIENPSVFSAIIDSQLHSLRSLPPLVCPSGQPSIAAYRLMDQLAASGVRINYAGDFDIGGLEIGVAIAARYERLFRPWFYDTASYLWAIEQHRRSVDAVASAPQFDTAQLKRLQSLQIPRDEQLVGSMAKNRCLIYQETLIEKFVRFFECSTRALPD